MGLTTFGLCTPVRQVKWFICLIGLLGSVASTQGQDAVIALFTQGSMRCVLSGNYSSSAFFWRHTGYTPILTTKPEKGNQTGIRREQARLIKESSSAFLGTNDKCILDANQDLNICKPRWDIRDWKNVSSLDVPLMPVVDRRWEALPTIITKGSDPDAAGGTFEGPHVVNLNTTSPQVHLSVSIFAAVNSHIFLCDGADQITSSCYWLIINGWPSDNYRSAVRRCPPKTILNKTGECIERRIEHSGRIGVDGRWLHVYTVWDRQAGSLHVNYSDNGTYKELFAYTDTNKTFDVSHAILQSYTYHPTLWKLHEYRVLSVSPGAVRTAVSRKFATSSNQLCVSFFYRFISQDNFFNITLRNVTAPPPPLQINDLNTDNLSNEWREAKFMYNVSDPLVLIRGMLGPGNTSHQIVLDSVRQCSPGQGNSDVRVLSVRRVLNVDVACESLQDPALKVTYQKPSVDPAHEEVMEALLERCITLYNKSECRNTLLCDQRGCYCDSGFTGDVCQYPCTNRTYGFGCWKTCGKCLNDENCNKVNGSCTECQDTYKPDKCNDAYIILSSPPELIGQAGATSATFKIDVTNFTGQGTPSMLIIQWREYVTDSALGWNKGTTNVIDLSNPSMTVEVGGLKANTDYEVRGVLVDKDKQTQTYAGVKVPSTIINTTCNDELQEDSATTITTSETSLIVETKLSHASCNFTQYIATLGRLAPIQMAPKSRSTWTWDRLDPFTNYTLLITRNKMTIVNKTITTNESAPSEPQNVNAAEMTDNTVTLSWKQPEKLNGRLRHYSVNITVKSSDLLLPPQGQDVEQDSTCGTDDKQCYKEVVSGLYPSTTYTASISGVTVAAGPAGTVEFRTKLWPPELATPASPKLVNDTTYIISLPPASGYLTKTSIYFIVIEELKDSSRKIDPVAYCDKRLDQFLNKTNNQDNGDIWVEDQLKPPYSELLSVTIGNNSGNEMSNADPPCFKKKNFQPGSQYRIYVVLVNGDCTESISTHEHVDMTVPANTSPQLPSSAQYSLLWLILLILPVPVVFWIFSKYGTNWCKWSTTSTNNERAEQLILRSNVKTSVDMPAVLRPVLPEPAAVTTDISGQAAARTIASHRVTIRDLAKYVIQNLSNGELQRQHAFFPRGQTKPWDYGRLPQNKGKNRYGNQLAYDDSRVVLAKLPEDPFSDYINANYVDGYNSSRFYIATQGPKEQTVNDFWRMVWQEKVQLISMLANLVENGKAKCEQYWPENSQEVQYGLISVMTVDVQLYADFIFREFHVSRGNEQRKVTQLHFTSWPDHGIPQYTESVASYLKKMLAIPRGSGPILVHCSAGVGRTGTIIVMDACLRMAAAEGAVDVFYCMQRARDNRPNMVDNFEQYKLIHLVLVECLLNEPTGLPCDETLQKKVKQLKTSGAMATMFQNLIHHFHISNESLDTMEEIQLNKHKNRVTHIVPGRTGRIFLSRLNNDDPTSDYINAVTVDGFRNKDQFIATQFPLYTTIRDFWRMIFERGLSFVVVMNTLDMKNDKSMCVFWPQVGDCIQLSESVLVLATEERDQEFWTTRTFRVSITDTEADTEADTDTKTKSQEWSVKMLHLKGWAVGGPPPAPTVILRLWQETEVAYETGKPILVSCFDGSTACGLFIGLSFIIEKMKLEQECDVSLAVKTIRHNRAQFVPTSDQFEWFFDAALSYLEQFQTYANFQTNSNS